MKAQELRIGNLVWNEIQQIPCEVDLKIIRDQLYGPNFWQPIPLTEEWLLRFGFKRFCKDFALKGIIIHTRKRGFVLRKSVPIIKYVHQLQNLYFALTNEELICHT